MKKIIIILAILYGVFSGIETTQAFQAANYLGMLLWPIFGMLPAAVILTIIIGRTKQMVQ